MSPHLSHDEFERSYDVGDDVAVPPLVGVAGVRAESARELHELDAVYFDTRELALARAGVAVRHRRGGSDAGWHIKRARADRRSEQQWPSAENAVDVPSEASAAVPGEVRAAVSDVVGDAELVPVARVTNRRHIIRLVDAAGREIAELCDDHVTGTNLLVGRSESWREWEVELSPAAAAARPEERDRVLDSFEKAILAAGALPSATGSKLARALGGPAASGSPS